MSSYVKHTISPEKLNELVGLAPNEEISIDDCCLNSEPAKYPEGTPEAATHYHGAIQPIKVMEKILTPEQFEGFLIGNIIKYSFRAGKKKNEPLSKDLTKVNVYTSWLREFRERGYISI